MTLTDFNALLPIIFLIIWALVLLMADLWIPNHRKGITAALAVVGLAACLGIVLVQVRGSSPFAFNNMAVVDGFAVFFDGLFLATGIVGVGLAYDYLKRMKIERGEYYVLLLFSISGMMLMAHAYDLIVIFLALELLSIPLYVLSGFARPRLDSEEAALKYFILGAFSSGFILYGVALIFAATGHTGFQSIVKLAHQAPGGGLNQALFLVGAALTLVGFGFKVAAVPFHMWAPDVYQGAPSPVSGFMSVGAKAAGFAALLRLLLVAFPTLTDSLTPVLLVLAGLTMVVGNILGIVQTNIKRLLAYSSIAHAGYLLMATATYGQGRVAQDAASSVLFYLVTYGLASLGAWAVVIALEQNEGKGLALDDYAGLGRKHPRLAFAMAIFMLSFTGMPLTLGFWGKLYLFRTAVEGGFAGLAVIGVLASLVSAYYYLRVIVLMYMRPGDPIAVGERWINFTAVAAAVILVGLSFLPGTLLSLVNFALAW